MKTQQYCPNSRALENNCRAWALVIDTTTKVVTLVGLMGLTNTGDDMALAAVHEMCVELRPITGNRYAPDDELVCGNYSYTSYHMPSRSGTVCVGLVDDRPEIWWPWAQAEAKARGYAVQFKLVVGGSSLVHAGE